MELTVISYVPEKSLKEQTGCNLLQEAIEEIEATECSVRKFTDLCNSVLSGRISLDNLEKN